MSSGPNPSGRPESITMDAAATATGEPKPADKRPTTEADGATHKAHGLETGLLMMALCLSVFLAALDITIVTTALPTIATHFHSASGYVWVGSAFLLGGAAATPNWGKFSDVWGRKTVLQLAAATFFVGSALCGASVSLAMLIVGRAVQGVGAGGLLSMVNIIIGDLFSQRERGKYYGMIGMVWAVASALGPVVGGAFTNNVSWRWCFYINLPITGAVSVLIATTLKIHTPKTPIWAGVRAVDWLGSLAITGGTLMVLLGIQLGGDFDPWASVRVVCLLVFGTATLALFLLIEWNVARYPVLPLHIYSNRSNVGTLLVVFFHGITFTQCTYFLPVYFQSVLGANPLLSGVWLLPLALALALASVATGLYIKSTGRYLDGIRVGFAFAVLGAGLLYDLPRSTRDPSSASSWARIVLFQILAGMGTGANFQPPLIALQSNISPQDNATATASLGLARSVASAVAVVVGSAAFARAMSAKREILRAAGGGDRVADLLSGSKAQGNLFVVETLDAAQRTVVQGVLYDALRNIWIETVCFCAAGLLACLLIEKKKLQKTHVEVKTGLEGEEARRKIAQEMRMKEKKNDSMA